MNRLSKELSPYLLQHANNPVDWYPWSQEAFVKAKEENKPIFLSIGYSTCHWCHVMEHESFEDDSVASLLNDWFISIKVDREELPEIDHLYMSVCQAMTGGGGWPLTIVMTPDKEPFFAGTYFPKDGRGQRPGMLQILPALHDAWTNKRDEISKSIDQIKSFLIRSNSHTLGEMIDENILEKAFQHFENRFDSEYGGFGSAPKFPSPHNLIFLLHYYDYTNNNDALKMVENTLERMHLGGIYDHVGFGFHRYSTDRKWIVPHFEKMLYDQGMISMAYVEAYQMTGNEFYANIAYEIFEYILRDMTDENGGFYSAEDADSEGEEGKFYIWEYNEIIEILGDSDGKMFSKIFNISPTGNFHDESSGQNSNHNIPHLQESLLKLSEKMNIPIQDLKDQISGWRKKLFDVRENRIHPLKDDKILTDWNGLMIAALAKGSVALNNPQLAKTAQKSANFILDNLTSDNGRLLKRYRNGTASLTAHLDDYAFFIWGLLELYTANFNLINLRNAVDLATIMVEDFWNDNAGGFYLGADDAETLMVRTMTAYDGAIPSGNSVAVNVLNRLARITGNMDWLNKSEKTMRTFSNKIKRTPAGFTHMLSGFMFNLDIKEVVIVGNNNKDTWEFIQAIRQSNTSNMVLLFKNTDEKDLKTLAPWTKSQIMLDGKPTAYICKNFACNQPTNDIKLALKEIEE